MIHAIASLAITEGNCVTQVAATEDFTTEDLASHALNKKQLIVIIFIKYMILCISEPCISFIFITFRPIFKIDLPNAVNFYSSTEAYCVAIFMIGQMNDQLAWLCPCKRPPLLIFSVHHNALQLEHTDNTHK